MTKLRTLSLFAGIGGFDLGLERTGGFETVGFCEIDPFCRRVLAKHWPDVPCYEDVKELTAARLAADGIAVDVVCGGFPCQDISPAGKGAGIDGRRSGLWSEFARLIGDLRPRLVIVENSSLLVRRGLGRVLFDLADLRYDAEWEVIPASAIGAPHHRARTWLIAYPERGERRDEPYLRSLGRVGREFKPVPWDGDWESALRRFRGMDDGLSYGVDRIDTLRNAVVPQIPELIGRAILSSLNQQREAA